jgi:GNAT superfamily N-acetyltransferase
MLGNVIRAARADDLAALRDIERVAGDWAAIGMQAIADDEPPSVEELGEYQRDGRAWVYADADDRPLAYLIARWVDGSVHIEQVSVHPGAAGRRIGRALIDAVAGWARRHHAAALTLTTFTEVPWNAPYYLRLGFRPLTEGELTPGLWEIRAAEAAHGLDRWPRTAMRREL